LYSYSLNNNWTTTEQQLDKYLHKFDCKGKYFFSVFQGFPYCNCNISLFLSYNKPILGLFRFDVNLGYAPVFHTLELAEGGGATATVVAPEKPCLTIVIDIS